MNSNQILSSTVLGLFLALGLTAQERSKTYEETFNVSDGAVLEINTSHADIEFDTWDKNQVAITAVVTLEGATDEESKDFLEDIPIEIKGNSQNIEINTYEGSAWRSNFLINGRNNFDFRFESAELPEVELLFDDLAFPELPELMVIPKMPEMPPMPPIPFVNFDYKKYKKDGDKYLKKWKKEFDEDFDENYRESLEAWSEEMKHRSEEMKARIEERKQIHKEALRERERVREERHAILKERQEARQEQREAFREMKRASRKNQSYIFSQTKEEDGPTIFYFSSDGEEKRYKVKKSIKIKMPKSVKLKMNVKHGAVKLAALSKDVEASLRYASLRASTIEGNGTQIRASYSPIYIDQWNRGRLNTDYSDVVELYEVGQLDLDAVSSNVTIHKLNDNARVRSNLGALKINHISDSFTDMTIDVKNGELQCRMPSSAYVVEVEGIASEVHYPKNLVLEKNSDMGTIFHSGYYLNKTGEKFIVIDSKYSEVVLKD